jgi:hypothetical protein
MTVINTNIEQMLSNISTTSSDTLNIDWDSISLTDIYTNTTLQPVSFNDTCGVSVTQGDIQMSGSGDIKFGEISLRESLHKIEERLAILKPNEKLEAEWDELKELGNRYRELEKELLEKANVWNILKK